MNSAHGVMVKDAPNAVTETAATTQRTMTAVVAHIVKAQAGPCGLRPEQKVTHGTEKSEKALRTNHEQPL
jgi:hypothetical protein